MSDAMKQGSETAKTGIARLVQEAGESGDPEAYWQGVLLIFGGSMAAQVGHESADRIISNCLCTSEAYQELPHE